MKEGGDLDAGRFRKDERSEKARVEINHLPAALQLFVARLAQQFGACSPQSRHRRAKGDQVI